MERKQFKTVAWVRQVRNAHYEALKDKTPTERIAFYREKAQKVHREIECKQRDAGQPATIGTGCVPFEK